MTSRRHVKVKGETIRTLREAAFLERRELGEMVGITRHAIYMIEKHRQTTSRSTLRKIATALDATPSELVEEDAEVPTALSA